MNIYTVRDVEDNKLHYLIEFSGGESPTPSDMVKGIQLLKTDDGNFVLVI